MSPQDNAMNIYAPVDPVYRIPDARINDKMLVERALTRFEQFEADRSEWLMRREEYYLGWDDYLSPVRKGPWEGSSNAHLPLTEIQCMAMHARIMQAFFFIDPWFYVDPQEETDLDRIQKIEHLMKYIVTRYCNYNKGIYSAIDDWAWDLVTDGTGILSRDWRILQRRAIVVEPNPAFAAQKDELENLLSGDIDADEFAQRCKVLVSQPFKEKRIVRTVFNGPIVTAEDPAYILFKGNVADSTDLNLHETVIKVCYFTRDELIGFKQSEFMDEDAIDEILKSPPQKRGTSTTHRASRLEYARDRQTGIVTQASSAPKDEYELLCVYDRVALEVNERLRSFAMADELIYFVHPGTKQLTRWTYLDRVSSTGKRNLHMAHLYRRPRRSTGRGMVETQMPLNETADILLNQGIDAGMLANQPMFGFRGNATFDPQVVRSEPGLGLRMDDPNNDLRFFTWNINPSWAQPFQGLIQSMSQQLTSLGALSLGGNVAGNRSNSQTQSLLGETSVNLDVILKRAKMAFSELLEGLFEDCLDRMPARLHISCLGPDGEPMLSESGVPERIEISKEDLRAKIHFGLYANSQNMNRMAQEAAAQKLAQFLLQPIGLQTGVVRPENVYEIYQNVVRTLGTQRAYRFLSKPQTSIAIPLQAELMMIMQGMTPPIVVNDPDHQKKIEHYQELLDSDQAALEVKNGTVNPKAMAVLQAALKKHEEMLAALEKPTNLENPTGMQLSPTGGAQGVMGPALAEGPSGGANNFEGPNPGGDQQNQGNLFQGF